MATPTPLHDRHLAAGARMVEFAGYDMPLQYATVRSEHLAVRERAGLFDLSHMGEVTVGGGAAEETIQRLLAGDAARIRPGGAQYAVMCNDEGGIVDDVLAYRDDASFMVVVNASCRQKDVGWMRAHAAAGSTVTDDSDGVALVALQGPLSEEVLQPLAGADLSSLRPFHHARAPVAGVEARISRTGYTGEDGFELFVPPARAGRLWDALLEAGRKAGVVPAGLAARDTLRLEAGLRLYGQDMDESVDPFSCGLGWTVRRRSGFIGAQALSRLDPAAPPRRFVGLALPPGPIPRHGHPVLSGGEVAGEVTSGGFGFAVGHVIATASVLPAAAAGPLSVEIRGAAVPARTVALPFHRRGAVPAAVSG